MVKSFKAVQQGIQQGEIGMNEVERGGRDTSSSTEGKQAFKREKRGTAPLRHDSRLHSPTETPPWRGSKLWSSPTVRIALCSGYCSAARSGFSTQDETRNAVYLDVAKRALGSETLALFGCACSACVSGAQSLALSQSAVASRVVSALGSDEKATQIHGLRESTLSF